MQQSNLMLCNRRANVCSSNTRCSSSAKRQVLKDEEELDQRCVLEDLKIFSSDSIWLDFVLRGLGKRTSSSKRCLLWCRSYSDLQLINVLGALSCYVLHICSYLYSTAAPCWLKKSIKCEPNPGCGMIGNADNLFRHLCPRNFTLAILHQHNLFCPGREAGSG